ncbi:MAG: prephenate dehydratase [Deltaproteobacteria bacterium]|nr:prephenate dehydratase [Deltaproteobacteria bacterium]
MSNAGSQQSESDIQSVGDLRKRIDHINLQLVDLLSERARLAQAIGHLKQAGGSPIVQPSREGQVFESVTAHNPGPLTGEHLRRIFVEIISACTALERPVRVAYLGPEHTYSHEAARARFGASAGFEAEPSIAAVFQAVENSRADLGVVPVENTSEGSVGLTLDLLIDTPCSIIAEILMPIRHAIMSREGDPARIQRILSHQQSLGQCRNYLAARYPHCELEAVASNAFAAKRAADDNSIAAICSATAADAYGLVVIESNIQDVAQNTTRFLVLGRGPASAAEPERLQDQPLPDSTTEKTSLVFAIPERAGALHAALRLFAREKINLTMIQSRPQRERPWAYTFFVDFQGSREDERAKRALSALEGQALFLKVLGSYPEGR